MHVNCKLLPYMYICSSYINKIIVTSGNTFSDVKEIITLAICIANTTAIHAYIQL